MAEESDEAETVEESPAYRGVGRFAGIRSPGAPAVEEPDGADDDRGLEWNTEEGVGPSAMVLKGGDRAV